MVIVEVESSRGGRISFSMKVRKNANITEQMLKGYEEYFRGEEQGGATIGKYI